MLGYSQVVISQQQATHLTQFDAPGPALAAPVHQICVANGMHSHELHQDTSPGVHMVVISTPWNQQCCQEKVLDATPDCLLFLLGQECGFPFVICFFHFSS